MDPHTELDQETAEAIATFYTQTVDYYEHVDGLYTASSFSSYRRGSSALEERKSVRDRTRTIACQLDDIYATMHDLSKQAYGDGLDDTREKIDPETHNSPSTAEEALSTFFQAEQHLQQIESIVEDEYGISIQEQAETGLGR
jgi:hypothetical protein